MDYTINILNSYIKGAVQLKKLVNTAFFYAIAAMVGGVFFREFTKFNGFTGKTVLATLHVHLFVLGMLFFLIATLLESRFSLSEHKLFRPFYLLYNGGLILTVSLLVWRGVTEVLALPLSRGLDASISGMAGMGHIILSAGIIVFFISLRKQIFKNV